MHHDLKTLLDTVSQKAHSNLFRYTLVISGEQHWCGSMVDDVVKHLRIADVLWVTEQPISAGTIFTSANAQHYLGMEFKAVIFDIYNGFDPDRLAALTGTIVGGGLLIVLAPPLETWEQFQDPEKARIAIWPYQVSDISGRFLKLIAGHLEKDHSVHVLRQNQPMHESKSAEIKRSEIKSPEIKSTEAKCHHQTDNEKNDQTPKALKLTQCRTEDQQRAVQAILHVVSGHRHRPLVITSDRGRGKSAALGIAAALLLKQGIQRIVVTAPRPAAVAPLFECAARYTCVSRNSPHKLKYNTACLEFIAPDELLNRHYECNLLMVDEAAAIPASMLERLLKQYSRIVFSTTIHGYEGTGRGFVLRFQNKLEQIAPGWQAVRMDTPIRWARHDPLERFIFDALLLGADAAPDDEIKDATVATCRFEKIDREILGDDKHTLSQIFGLLVLAHYQTQPADLRYLLDAKDLSVYVLRYKKNIVAAAVLEAEGNITPPLAQKIYANQRRLRGHLMAQTLATYVGLAHAPLLKYLRVMRIAVHPVLQNKGLGHYFLQQLQKIINGKNYDAWGASFGATPELMNFWRRTGFAPVYIGMKRNAASGLHAALVLQPLTEQGNEMYKHARQKFVHHFPHSLAESYRDLEPELVKTLCIADSNEATGSLTKQDWQDIVSFVKTARAYEVNAVPIWNFLCSCLQQQTGIATLDKRELALLIGKVLQKRSWAEMAQSRELTGTKQARTVLRGAVEKLYEQCFQDRIDL